jgi:hypothetical protein
LATPTGEAGWVTLEYNLSEEGETMTGSELSERLASLADVSSLGNDEIAGWIDSCQKEVALDLPVLSYHSLPTVVADTFYPLTHIILKVTEVKVEGELYDIASVNVIPEGVTFTEALTNVIIKYESLPDTYTDTTINDELSIHPALHAIVVYYLLFCFYNTEGEGDTEETNLAELYYSKWVYLKDKAIERIVKGSLNYSEDDPVSALDLSPPASHRTRWGGEEYE